MTFHTPLLKTLLLPLTTLALLTGCESDTENQDSMTPFTLNFSAVSGSEQVSCDSTFMGFGHEGHYSVSVSDLRFYVSNLAFYDQYGEMIEVNLDDSDFQLNHEKGSVALVDLTSNSSGSCANDAIQYAEGTARTNSMITGMMMDTGISKVTFDIGVPQSLMKEIIGTSSAEDAPSPLNEMYWSWASGYRHLVMNFAIENMSGHKGEGYLHIGSRGCGSDGLLALENKDSCDFINTPKVELNNFDPTVNTIALDINALLADLPFTASMSGGHGSHSENEHSENTDMMTPMPSVTCHSAAPSMQPDCGSIFANLGLNTDDGSATAASNSVVVSQ
ncbi:MAG: metallo-mystery pair system four-Cys motif protein [Gammaproteobacteria bacterium]|nr:metallo-mystery pair system four-Cys motif protein [Gammaproteobacteria bacterium]